MLNKKCPNCESHLPVAFPVGGYQCVACGFKWELPSGKNIPTPKMGHHLENQQGKLPVNALIKFPTNQLPVCGYCGSKNIHLHIKHHVAANSFIDTFRCDDCSVLAKSVQDSITGTRRWNLIEMHNVDLFRKLLMPKFSKDSLDAWLSPFSSPEDFETAATWSKPEEFYLDDDFKETYEKLKSASIPGTKLEKKKAKQMAEETTSKMFKYQINYPADGAITLKLPKGAVIRKLAWQNDKPMLWVEVDNEADEYEVRHFQGFATGQFVVEYVRYIDTLFEEDENLVWHYYELAGE